MATPSRCTFCGLSVEDHRGGSLDDLLADLAELAAARDRVDRVLVDRVARLREQGVPWARVGASLGVSRQAAWERFSARMP